MTEDKKNVYFMYWPNVIQDYLLVGKPLDIAKKTEELRHEGLSYPGKMPEWASGSDQFRSHLAFMQIFTDRNDPRWDDMREWLGMERIVPRD